MRFVITLLLSLVPLASGFSPSTRPAFTTALSGGGASTHEEDLEMTYKVIMDHIATTDFDSESAPQEAPPAAAEETKAPKKKKKKKKAPPPAEDIDISKLNILVGVINKAWEHEEADKLFCEEIDVGENEPRQIASGLRAYYKAEELEGRRVCVLANLKSRKLVGFPSHGMVLCASTDDGSKVVFVDPPEDAAIGERVKVDGFDGEPATENQVIKKKMLDAVFPDLRTDSSGVASYKGVPLEAGTGKCIAEGGLADAQVS